MTYTEKLYWYVRDNKKVTYQQIEYFSKRNHKKIETTTRTLRRFRNINDLHYDKHFAVVILDDYIIEYLYLESPAS